MSDTNSASGVQSGTMSTFTKMREMNGNFLSVCASLTQSKHPLAGPTLPTSPTPSTSCPRRRGSAGASPSPTTPATSPGLPSRSSEGVSEVACDRGCSEAVLVKVNGWTATPKRDGVRATCSYFDVTKTCHNHKP